ncbi:hypothetical protein Q9L58_008053 [Maublancomyces gigas]|uniref:HNH nuclease domain-containing protein n=1 Tax=Discina gigas TaxID=1032678 RepID=A0ABR3GAQ4_9PEZI
MSVSNRSAGRDVQVFDANDSATALGGLILSNGITNANFYSMIEVFLFFESNYVLRHEDATDALRDVPKDEQALQPGNYYIVTDGRLLNCHEWLVPQRPDDQLLTRSIGSITANNEDWLVRTVSVASGTRVTAFRDAVRDRDRRCAITGKRAHRADYNIWRGFEAAHIFPLAYEAHWKEQDYGRWISIPPATESAGFINSVQNGMLLRADIHSLFDNYDVSINPDDRYKIVCFNGDGEGMAGRHLDQQFLDDPRRPVDQLFHWHFRQAVLANMRGAGEPIFESDFPPGSDMIGEILSGPKAGERLEFEFFSRLAGVG